MSHSASDSSLDAAELFGVKGVVAVITGGGTGIGLAMAKALEHNGAIVYIIGRRKDVLMKAASENSKYGNIIPLQGDVTSNESLQTVVEIIKGQRGYINLLVNNAGVAGNILNHCESCGSDIRRFQEMLWKCGPREDWGTSFDVNVTAAYYTTVAFLELLHLGNMRNISENPNHNAPTSQVILVTSGAAFRRDDKVFSLSYGASKAAATQLAKTLASLLKDWHIRTNVIAPGIFITEMTDGLVEKDNVSADAVPLKRNGTDEDMGGLVLFLASRAGAYVNGCVHLSDGGRLCLFSSSY